MEKQTAVEQLQEWLNSHLSHDQQMQFEGLFQQAKQIEIQQSHEYAEFAIKCDREGMKILNFNDFIKLE
jgi:hypothetical protein